MRVVELQPFASSEFGSRHWAHLGEWETDLWIGLGEWVILVEWAWLVSVTPLNGYFGHPTSPNSGLICGVESILGSVGLGGLLSLDCLPESRNDWTDLEVPGSWHQETDGAGATSLELRSFHDPNEIFGAESR